MSSAETDFRDQNVPRTMAAPAWAPSTEFRALFDAAPGLFLVLLPDDPTFTIVDASNAYAEATLTTREEIVGRGVFEVFPDSPQNPEANSVSNLQSSLRRVLTTKARDMMAVRKYDIPSRSGAFEVRYWHPVNAPVLAPDGKVQFIIHSVEDVTASVLLKQSQERTSEDEALRERSEELTDFVENATVGLHWVDADGKILWANQAELDLLGYTREEYIGHHISEFHADTPVIEDILRRLVCREELHGYNARLRAKDGSVKHVRISSNVLWKNDAFIHTRCFTHDVTEQKKAEEARQDLERQLMLLIEASGALLSSPQTSDVLRNVLETSTTFVAADAYAVWRKEPTGRTWKLVTSRGLSEGYERTASEHALASGLSLPSEPFAVEDVERFPLLQQRIEFYRAEGIRSMLTIPLCIHGELGGTIVFYHRELHRFDEAELRLGAALGNLAATALGTAELYARQVELRGEAERAERRASFLAEAGAVLGSSLDYEVTLARVAQTAVPSLADWCTVDLLDKEGTLRSVALAHQDPAKAEFARQFRRKYPPRDSDLSLTAVRTGKSIIIEEISDKMLVQGARSEEHLREVRQLKLTSFLVVPLVARSRVLGALTFVSAESGNKYTAADLQFAEELAARAASAIDNAQLHADVIESEQRTAFLLRLDDALRTLTDPNEITHNAARLLGMHLGVNRCAYADVEQDERTFNLTGDYTNGVQTLVGRYTLEQFGEHYAALCSSGRTYIVEDSESDPRCSEAIEAYRAAEIRAVIAAPLQKAGRLVAGMAVHQSLPRKWRSDEVELVQQVASRCWESIVRAQVARELKESEGRFRQLANAIPAFVWVTTADGQLTFVNERWYAYTGLDSGSSLGYGWADTLHADDRQRVNAMWLDATKRQVPYAIECRYLGADGLYRWFMARALPVRDSCGAVVQWFGTSTDIHDAKRTEEALRQANADLEQFAYSASHDLKEPLRMVSVYSQIVQRKYAGRLDQEADQYLTFVVEGAQRMDLLVQDLLDYTRTAAVGDEPITPANTNDILKQALSNLQNAIDESGANVTVGNLPENLRVKDVHLLQLFQNIIGNAIKYRGEIAPAINVQAEPNADMWKVCVKDNGIGIDPQYADQIFGIFKRLHSPQKYSGTGIGLAICEKIVHRYGGRIWVQSEGEGKGSNFCFTLPDSRNVR